MTSGLKIPTTEFLVDIALLGVAPVRMGLLLAEREQSLLGLLEGEEKFLPAFASSDRSWSILNKRSIVWLAIALVDGSLPIEEVEFDTALYEQRVEVKVDLSQGESLQGEVLFTPPSGKARLTDYLNDDTVFFRVWTSDAVFIVNKQHVLRLAEIAH